MTKHCASVSLISEAVQSWYSFYEVDPDDRASDVLRKAALELFAEGHCTSEDIATHLIGSYVGKWATRVNAPSSSSVH